MTGTSAEPSRQDLVSLYERLESVAWSRLANLDIDSGDFPRAIPVCLFIRMLDGGRSAVWLLEKGSEWDASILLRSEAEALILLANVISTPAFLKY